VRIGKLIYRARRHKGSDRPDAVSGDAIASLPDGQTKLASELVHGDLVVVAAGDVIPCDGTVVEGLAMVDESAMTGESAPVLHEAGSDRATVIAGTRVLTNRIVIKA
jgi:potassium-transporting ATPase ATP-binding subunit